MWGGVWAGGGVQGAYGSDEKVQNGALCWGTHGGGAGWPEAGGSLGGGWGRLAPHMARGPQAYSPDFLAE